MKKIFFVLIFTLLLISCQKRYTSISDIEKKGKVIGIFNRSGSWSVDNIYYVICYDSTTKEIKELKVNFGIAEYYASKGVPDLGWIAYDNQYQ